jgi:hypothetical protein
MSKNARLLQGSVRLRAADKLRLYWDKAEGLMCFHPLGTQTQCDAGFLAGVFDKGFLDELTRRGYDVATLRFSIKPQKGNQRFASQRTDGGCTPIVPDGSPGLGPNAKLSDAPKSEGRSQ